MAFEVSDGKNRLRVEASRLEVRPHDELFDITIDDCRELVSISRISPTHFSIILDGRSYNVEVDKFNGSYQVETRGEVYSFRVTDERETVLEENVQAMGRVEIKAPMPGMVVEILQEEGSEVSTGSGVMVLEAMKMQNEIASPSSGTVTEIPVKAGDSVNVDELLFVVEDCTEQ